MPLRNIRTGCRPCLAFRCGDAGRTEPTAQGAVSVPSSVLVVIICRDGPSRRMRVLYIEDDDVLARLVQLGLRRTGLAVDHAATAEEGLSALDSIAYDAVVLDLTLPDADGLTVLRQLRARRNTTPVLILSARNRMTQRVAGLDAGADDYLPKPFEVPELAARLRALARRPRTLIGAELTCANLTYIPAEHTMRVGGNSIPLPRREASVLEILMRNAGRPVSKPILEERLYAFGEEVASNAVEVHIHHLRKRLAAAGVTARIETRRGTGYLIAAAGPGVAPGRDA
ncbi:response regulator [Roseicella aerolata]|uniref:Response regulator transcription factor n=1 Tax=Roseicella aerolata TaxID=2883479 RepID=A0A9X1IBJ4_9PROT|nr:response regulator transcription factor [Roseicella aerolata]MCB4821357.1 response regulator transcription factor [Roseicella aerolata]